MLNHETDTFFSSLSSLNRVLGSVLVVLVLCTGYLFYSGDKKINSLKAQEEYLKKHKENLVMLESFFKNISIEEKSLENELSRLGVNDYSSRNSSGMTAESLIKSLALKHGLIPGWVDDIKVQDGSGPMTHMAIGFAITGTFSRFKTFLKDLIVEPQIGRITLIQIQSEFELLDIMLNIEPSVMGNSGGSRDE